MIRYGLPLLYALFVWWFSTGLIVYLDGLPRRTFRWTMLGATALLAAALYGLAVTSADASVAGAYLAFTCGLIIWGWHEISFLTGFLTGRRRVGCPEGCAGWRHAGHAIDAILYHELAILASAAATLALTWGGANRIGAWTFLILWGMRLSAKLNIFLGVPNVTEEFLPAHLQFLKSFFARKAMNLLFPVSVTVSTIIVTLLMQRALAPGAGAFEAAGATLLAALVLLGLIEHWFLVLPLPVAALWSWSLRSHAARDARPAGSGAVPPASARDADRPGPQPAPGCGLHPLPSPSMPRRRP